MYSKSSTKWEIFRCHCSQKVYSCLFGIWNCGFWKRSFRLADDLVILFYCHTICGVQNVRPLPHYSIIPPVLDCSISAATAISSGSFIPNHHWQLGSVKVSQLTSSAFFFFKPRLSCKEDLQLRWQTLSFDEMMVGNLLHSYGKLPFLMKKLPVGAANNSRCMIWWKIPESVGQYNPTHHQRTFIRSIPIPKYIYIYILIYIYIPYLPNIYPKCFMVFPPFETHIFYQLPWDSKRWVPPWAEEAAPRCSWQQMSPCFSRVPLGYTHTHWWIYMCVCV